MRSTRTSLAHRTSRTARGAVVAVLAGAGVALSPLPATAAPPAAAVAAAPAPAAQIVIDTAYSQQGKPYRWGASGPGSFDCSGLVKFAYRAAGIDLPHSSRIQSTMGVPIHDVYALQPGDLLFFYSPVSHVGIYLGNGWMVHASTAGRPVAVVAAASMPEYAGARRIV